MSQSTNVVIEKFKTRKDSLYLAIHKVKKDEVDFTKKEIVDESPRYIVLESGLYGGIFIIPFEKVKDAFDFVGFTEYPDKGGIKILCKGWIKENNILRLANKYKNKEIKIKEWFCTFDEAEKWLEEKLQTKSSEFPSEKPSKKTLPFKNFKYKASQENRQYLEGAMEQVNMFRRKRNREARKICIENYRSTYTCDICGFNFEKWYGFIGEHFIHVHHLDGISKFGEQVIDLERLVPVCPNCHAMLHANPPLDTDPDKNFEAIKQKVAKLRKIFEQ